MLIVCCLLLTNADTRLAEIRAHFSVAALESLAHDAQGSEAGGEAAAWRGAVALGNHDLDGAAGWFELARSAPPGGEAVRQAERGLGDLDLLQRRYSRALAHYQAAALGARPILAEELLQKSALARRLGTRQRVEWLAWLVWCASCGYFLLRAWRGRGPLRLPLETLFALPIYTLFIAGAWRRDTLIMWTLAAGGALSLLFICLSGLASRRSPPEGRLRWLHAGLLIAGNLALFYAVLNRGGLVDSLITTAQM